MERAELTNEQRDRILFLEEDHFNDLKNKRIKPAKLTEFVSSFANTSGGEIYLGVNELDARKKLREWDGFTDIEEANAHLQEVENLAPLGNHFGATFLSSEGESGYVLQL